MNEQLVTVLFNQCNQKWSRVGDFSYCNWKVWLFPVSRPSQLSDLLNGRPHSFRKNWNIQEASGTISPTPSQRDLLLFPEYLNTEVGGKTQIFLRLLVITFEWNLYQGAKNTIMASFWWGRAGERMEESYRSQMIIVGPSLSHRGSSVSIHSPGSFSYTLNV